MKKTSLVLALAALLTLPTLTHAAPISISNGDLAVTCDADQQELTFSRNGKPFAQHVKWWDGLGKVVTAKAIDIKRKDAAGKAIVIEGGQGSERFALLDGTPFVLATVLVNNTAGDDPVTITNIVPFSAPLTVAPTNFFSPEGNTPVKDTSSYLYLAAVDPATRAGVVTGWLTHEKGSGIVGAKVSGSLSIEPRSEYGHHAVNPKTTMPGETVAIGDFDDARLGLEAFADANVRSNAIKLRPPMSGYCTWYHAHASNEKDLGALADFARSAELKDYGFDFLQIDDGWQKARRDFRDFKKDGPYPAGMQATAQHINADGFVAGIWLTPFAWDATILNDHLDYFAKTQDGKPYAVKWAGDCLDMTNPAAQIYLLATINRLTHTWGYKYLKIDGLWAGMATTILYPTPNYRPDDLGGAVFFDKNATNISAYRQGLRTVRAGAGDDVFICGCNVAQNHRTLGATIGLVDAMRVGPDIKATWDSISTRAAVYATREYFLNGRVWWNDPDCLMLRGPDISLDEARAWGSWIAISGQLNVVSEDLAKLPPERLDVVKRTMPMVPHIARPADLFSTDGTNDDKLAARIWEARVGQGETARTIVGLFNWSGDKELTLKINLKDLGLEPGAYIGYDYWDKKFLGEVADGREFTLKPGSCKVLSIVKSLDRPQFLSSSRHVLQGSPDILDVKWDPATSTLSGRSNVIVNDAYELRLATGKYSLVNDAHLANVEQMDAPAPGEQVVRFKPAEKTGEIAWSFQFSAK